MRWLLIILLGLSLAGCVTTERSFKKIKPGMTRAEVVKILGPPSSSRILKSTEVLHYQIRQSINDWYADPYYVQMQNGKVIASGRQGVFPPSN